MELTAERRSFKISEFEGPLDLLLNMIRKNEVNIYDIPIAQITDQYIDYIKSADFIDLEDLSSFHSMAAYLLYTKSKTLLPVEMDVDDIEDPRAELVEWLIEYQKIKKLSELMEVKEENEWVIERRRLQHNLPFTDDDIWEKVDIWDLMKTFSTLTLNLPSESIIDLYEEITVNEKTTLLAEYLENNGECRFTELITHPGALDVVCAFLAVLEAAKMRMIILFQNRLFGDILIRPKAA